MTDRRPAAQPTFCTIISKNYMARARALAESLRRFHPDAPFHVLIVDRVDGYFEKEEEDFQITLLEELNIPDFNRFTFQYNILELNTAAKPYFLERLFQQFGIEKLIYLDPDILVLDSLEPLTTLLDTHAVLLTPHTTAPYPDPEEQREVDILKAGIFNLGFIGLRAGATTHSLLDWWKKRLYFGCKADLAKGFHVDQKWMDLVPSFFDGVYIIKEPGYNVATWNFHVAPITFKDSRFCVAGEPIKFFHFSAFDPFKFNVVSRHQHRYSMENIGELKSLFEHYTERLMHHGYAATVKWPYAFGAFSNGVAIPNRLRQLYLEMKERGSEFGNPFDSENPKSLYAWWQAQGENMKREQLTELLEQDVADWESHSIADAVNELDLYAWFRRANPRPNWKGVRMLGPYLKQRLKYHGLQLFMQWLPPLFAKQWILNRYLFNEIQRLASTQSTNAKLERPLRQAEANA